jgi:hypothetical protein
MKHCAEGQESLGVAVFNLIFFCTVLDTVLLLSNKTKYRLALTLLNIRHEENVTNKICFHWALYFTFPTRAVFLGTCIKFDELHVNMGRL